MPPDVARSMAWNHFHSLGIAHGPALTIPAILSVIIWPSPGIPTQTRTLASLMYYILYRDAVYYANLESRAKKCNTLQNQKTELGYFEIKDMNTHKDIRKSRF